MKPNPRALITPLVAALVFAVTLNLTASALRTSGTWRSRPAPAPAKPESPYERLDAALAEPLLPPAAGDRRDPFSYAGPRAAVAADPVRRARPAPARPARPVLTSIVWDNDPRATIRFGDRDYSVRENSLFAEYRVRSITRNQVVLERGGEPLVLTIRSKGD